jgi:hypothetical protein
MGLYYSRWQLNPVVIIEDPVERAKAWLQMLEMVKADMASGTMKAWGNCADGSGGYAIMEAENEEELFGLTLKWLPYVNFDTRPVITVEQTIEQIKKLASA